jgi:hypothetical protein
MKIDCTQEEWDELKEFASKRYVATKDRFVVENCIDAVAGTVNDLDSFIELYIDRPTKLSEDEIWSYLEGIKTVLKLRVENLWDAHRQREHIDGYGTIEEVMEQHRKTMAKDFPVPKKKGKKK